MCGFLHWLSVEVVLITLLCRTQMLDCVERELKGWMKVMVKLSGTCFVTFNNSMAAVVFVGKLCSQNHFEQSACATTPLLMPLYFLLSVDF